MIAEAALSALALAGAAHGALYQNSALFGHALGRLSREERCVALTFDDGPNPLATPHILDVLESERVPATFFVLGRHAERWPDLVLRAAETGHQLGNHGFYHRKLVFRGPAYVRRDLELGTTAVEEAAGVRPRFFRAPHGLRSPWVSSIARALGQRTVGWTLGVWDSERPGIDQIVQRTLVGTRPGTILLLHDGDGYEVAGDRRQTAEALPLIIRGLRTRGYQFVALPAE
jgi:peptidoglycan-N-acetylglucosamine deacetylase